MLRSGKGIIGHVIHTGETVLAPDVQPDPRYIAGRAHTLSELAVPIVSEAGVIGCLNVESDREATFSPVADAAVLRERGGAHDEKRCCTGRCSRSSASRTS